jgi:hypothetical protein
MRMVLDTMAPLDAAAIGLRSHYCFQPMMRPGEMRETFNAQGLADMKETSHMIRMDYTSFEDFWRPTAAGEGPIGKYIAALDEPRRKQANKAVRAEAGQPDGPRSFVAVAWACCGRVV